MVRDNRDGVGAGEGINSEVVLRNMVEFYKQDQRGTKWVEPGDVVSETDLFIRRAADVIMANYDILPARVREAFPRSVVDPAYKYFREITTVEDTV